MGLRTVEIFVCDICKRESKLGENTNEWLQWSQNHLVLDRSWEERCMCPVCVADVKVAIKNLGSK